MCVDLLSLDSHRFRFFGKRNRNLFDLRRFGVWLGIAILSFPVIGLTADLTWDNGTGDRLWNTTSANWTGSTFTDNDAVNFAETGAGNVTLTGNVVIAGGNIENTSTEYVFTGQTITTSGNLTIHNDVNATINSIIAGAGALVKQEKGGTNNTSNGRLFLTNANTYTGGTLLAEGTIEVTNSSAFGTGTVTVTDLGGDNPGIILSANNLNIANDFVFTNVGSRKDLTFDPTGTGNSGEISGDIEIQETANWATQVRVGSGDTLTLSGNISGAGNPRLRNSGTLILTNDNNSFVDPLYIDIGTLEVTSIADDGMNSAAGQGLNGNGNVDIRLGFSNSTGTLSYVGSGNTTDRQIQIGITNTNAAADVLQVASSRIESNGTNGGTGLVFTNTAFNIADTAADGKVGARTLTLAGTNTDANEIQGAIIDNNGGNGGINAVNTVNLVKAESGRWILSGTNTYTGTTTVSGGTLSISAEENLGAPAAFAADALNLAGGTLQTTATFTIDDANRGITTTDGTISTDAGTTLTIDNVIAGGNLNKAGSGNLILNGTNTFTGLAVNAGTVIAGSTSGLGNNANTDVATGASLQLGDNSNTIGALSGNGTVENASGTGAALTLGGGDESGTFSGVLQDGTGGGSLAVIKIGSGTQTLSGTSTATGATTVNAGRLNVATGGSLDSQIQINEGASLGGEGSTSGSVVFSGNSILVADLSTLTGAFSSTDLTTTGANVTVNFEGASSGSGNIVVFDYSGSYNGTVGTEFSIGSGLVMSGRGGGFVDNTTDKRIELSTGFENKIWTGTTDAVWEIGGAKSNWSGGSDSLFFDGDFVTFDNTGSNKAVVITGNNVAPTSVTFSNSGANDYTISSAASETLAASGGINNTGSGNVTINSVIADPSTGTTSLALTGNGSTTTLGANNTFTGGIVVNNGATVKVGGVSGTSESNLALGSASQATALTVSNGGTLDVNGNRNLKSYAPNSLVFSGVGVDGNGAVVNTGSQAQNAFDQVFFAGDLTLGGTGRFDFDGAISTNAGANLTVTKVGTNDIIFNGDNRGASIANFVVNSGGITAVNNFGFGNAAITVNSGAFVTGSINNSGLLRTLSNDITVNGGSIRVAFQSMSELDLTGTVSVAADSTLDPNSTDRVLRLRGTLTGTGGNLNIDNGNVVMATGNTSGFTGDFRLNNTDAVFALENGITVSQDIVITNNGAQKTLSLVDSSGGSATGTFSGGVSIEETTAGNFDVRAFATDTLTFSGAISGTGAAGVEKTEAGTVVFGADNTYTGPTAITAGTLQIGNGGASGTLGSGDTTNAGDLVFNRTGTSTYSGAISGAGNVTHLGTGTTTLAGENTYTGVTTVSAGTLNIGGNNTSNITVASGASLGGEGNTSGSIVFQGTHTIEVDGSTASALATTGTLDLSAVAANGITVNVIAGTTGFFDVIQYNTASGFIDANGGNFKVGTGVSARGAMFQDTGNAIQLSAGTVDNTWTGTTDGVWEIGGAKANWTGGAADTVFENFDNVIFNDSGANKSGVTITGADVTVGTATFTTTSGNDYTLSSAAAEKLIANGIMTFDNGGNVVVNSVIDGTGSLVKTAATSTGILELRGNNSYTGGTTFGEGRIDVFTNTGLGTGTVTLTSTLQPELRIAAGLNIANDIVFSSDAANKFIRLVDGTAGTAEISGNIQINETSTFRSKFRPQAGQTLILSGVISGTGNPTQDGGTGTLRLTNPNNSFDNPIRTSSGVLEITSIANSGVNSAAGSGTQIIAGSGTTDGTVLYTGNGDSSNRNIRIGSTNSASASGGAKILSSGNGALVFTNANFTSPDTGSSNVNNNTAARVLTLGGNNSGANEIQGVIQDNNSVHPGTISNEISVVKQDTGSWTLSGTNTYTGNTRVSGGTLLINGDQSGALGAVTVESGGTLGGNGTIGGNATISGTHTAGTLTGAAEQTFNSNLTIDNGATVAWTLINASTSNPGSDWDLFDVDGTLDFITGADDSKTFAITDSSGFDYGSLAPSSTKNFLVWEYANLTNFDPDDFNITYNGGAAGPAGGSFALVDNMSNGIFLRYTAIPEPSTYALLGLFAGLLGWTVRRRRKFAEQSS